MFSESHCHLRNISDQVIEQVKKIGVELVLNAGIDLTSSEQAALAAGKYRIVKAGVGIHPWNADQYNRTARRRLKELATYNGVVAMSEIGLDCVGRMTHEGEFVNETVEKWIQRNAFHEQLRLAKELHLPVIVHDRTPYQEVLDILEEVGNADIGAAIHGLSKDLAYAKRCVEMRVYISIGLRDISSSENEILKEVIRQTPLEWLLTETDSASPEGVLTVAKKIAEIKGLTRDDVGQATTHNLRRFTKLLQ
ncbi:MAG: TatD family hydrolase [Candidatus Bathyarchaeota archaeon]